MPDNSAGSRRWIAVAAIYALFLHSIVAGQAAGALAFPSAFQVICSADGLRIAPEAPGEPAGRSHFPECCLIGCPILGAAASVATLAIFAPDVGRRLPLPRRGAVVARGEGHSPAFPRGPPADA